MFNQDWYVKLEERTAEPLAQRLRNLLKDKRFTVVISQERFGFMPEVQTGNALGDQNPIEVNWKRQDNLVELAVNYATLILELKAELKNGRYENNPNFLFKKNTVTIIYYPTPENMVYFVFAVEEEKE